MTNEELKQAYANAFIELVMDGAMVSNTDLRSKDQRAIVIDGLREAMRFFADPNPWDEIH
jgi:CO/xanthine dehydrogenase FAD-binding subunit